MYATVSTARLKHNRPGASTVTPPLTEKNPGNQEGKLPGQMRIRWNPRNHFVAFRYILIH